MELTEKDTKQLIARYQNGDDEALVPLVDYHIAYVVDLLNKRRIRGEIFQDLVSAGKVGLIMAAGKCDITRDNKFITYAKWYIKSAMDEASRVQPLIPLKSKQYCVTNSAKSFINKYMDKHGCRPSDDTVIKNVPGMTAEYFRTIASRENDTYTYIDDPDNLKSLSYEHESMYKDNDKDLINEILDSGVLDEIERKVIVSRIYKNRTLRDVAKETGRTAEGIRLVQNRALRKLKQILV